MSNYAYCEIMVIGDRNCFNHFTDDIYEEYDSGVYTTPKGVTFLRVKGFFKYRREDLKEKSEEYKCKVEAYSYCFEQGGILHELYENGEELKYQRLEEGDLDGFQGDDGSDFYEPDFSDYFELLKSDKTAGSKSEKTTEESASSKNEKEEKKTTKSSGSETQSTVPESCSDCISTINSAYQKCCKDIKSLCKSVIGSKPITRSNDSSPALQE